MTVTPSSPSPAREREPICPPWCAGHDGRLYQSWEEPGEKGDVARRPHFSTGETHGGVMVSVGCAELPDGLLAPRVHVYAEDAASLDGMPDDVAHALGLAIVRAGDVVRRYNREQRGEA